MSKQDNWQWFSGCDDEYFTNGPFKCREDAIEALDGEGGHIIEAQRYPIKFNVARLIEDQYFDCDDYFSGEYETAARAGSEEFVAAADAELQALLDAWTVKWAASFVQPEMFCRQRNDEEIPADGEEVEGES